MTIETKPPTASTPVAEALDTIKKLAVAEFDFYTQGIAKKRELDGADIGGQVLDAHLSGQATEAMGTVSKLRAEIESLQRAATAARSRRVEAILSYNQAKAVEARQQAAHKTQVALQLEEKCVPHLEALRQIQGVDYIPRPLKPGYDSPLNVEVRSRSQVLKDDAVALNLQANEWSRRQVQTSITVSGVYPEDLVSGVVLKPMIVGPALPEVAEWVKAQRAKGVQGTLTLSTLNGRISQ
jgi:hypothetical protein